MADADSAERDDTPDMLQIAGNDGVLSDLANGSFTDEKAKEAGMLALAGLTAGLGIPKMTDLCVIQHGVEATRPDEPAHMTGDFMSANPHSPGRPGFFALVKFEDDHIDYVDMTWHIYPRKQTPPLLFSRKVRVEIRDDDGGTHQRVLQTNRREDRRGWLEFLAASACRRSLTVKED